MLYTPLLKVWKWLGGQDGGANINKNFCQKYNNKFYILCFPTIVKFKQVQKKYYCTKIEIQNVFASMLC